MKNLLKRLAGIVTTAALTVAMVTGFGVCVKASDEPLPPKPQKVIDGDIKEDVWATPVDRDTFKSEKPSGTVFASRVEGAYQFLDFKVHATDARNTVNQRFLTRAMVRKDAETILTEDVYPGRDLSITEDGSLQTLTWNNLPKNEAGPVYAVVYNQIDGAYVLSGALDGNGTATFSGFKLRPASTFTICK